MVAAAAAQLTCLVHHPSIKQLLWLVLWACGSLSSLFALRLLVHYDGFATPWFLALLSAAFIAVVGRVLVFLHTEPGSSEQKDWLHLSVTGVLMWVALALNAASLQSLPVPVVILLQVWRVSQQQLPRLSPPAACAHIFHLCRAPFACRPPVPQSPTGWQC